MIIIAFLVNKTCIYTLIMIEIENKYHSINLKMNQTVYHIIQVG